MNEPSPKPDPVVESAAALLRSREIPASARARVLQGLEGAVAAPGAGWSLGAKLGLVAVGGAAIVGIALRGVPKPPAPHEASMRAPAAASTSAPSPGRPPVAEVSQPSTVGPAAPPLAPSVPHAGVPQSGHPRLERKQTAPEAKPETLAEQVRDFRAALGERNAGQRAERLLAFQRKWPRSPLAHEVQLQLIATYGQARDVGAQEAAAAKFLAEHPESGRAGEVRAIAEGAVPDSGAPTRHTESQR